MPCKTHRMTHDPNAGGAGHSSPGLHSFVRRFAQYVGGSGEDFPSLSTYAAILISPACPPCSHSRNDRYPVASRRPSWGRFRWQNIWHRPLSGARHSIVVMLSGWPWQAPLSLPPMPLDSTAAAQFVRRRRWRPRCPTTYLSDRPSAPLPSPWLGGPPSPAPALSRHRPKQFCPTVVPKSVPGRRKSSGNSMPRLPNCDVPQPGT